MRKWQTIKEYEDIKFDFFEGIAKITINRPRGYNALSPAPVNTTTPISLRSRQIVIASSISLFV